MKNPNIILFLADQHRYDCTGYAKKYPVSTPNIDKTGEKGAVFTHAFTPTPVCAPARQAILSGRRPESFGALWNYNFIKTNTLMPSDSCFPRELAAKGYRNIFIGAWDGSTEPPEKFDLEHRHKNSDYAAYIAEKHPQIEYKNGYFGEKSPLPLSDSRVNWYVDKAVEELQTLSESQNPWFLWLDIVDPHLPCRPSPPFSEMYENAPIPQWDGFGDDFAEKPYIQKQQLYNWGLESMEWRDWEPTVKHYYSMISQVDDAFGRLCRTVEEMGLSDNTVIIYTSDHGDMCGSHGMIDKHYVLYDDVCRVPLVIKYPGAAEGVIADQFVSNCLDIAPTIGEIAGFELDCHGKSLLPLVRGEPQARDEYTVSAANGQQFGSYTQRSIRTKKYKYILNLTDTDEFYDLETDPGELKNLINDPQFDPIVAEMRKQLKAELLRCKDPFISKGWLNRQFDENKKLKRQ